jgi:hypothetical protein
VEVTYLPEITSEQSLKDVALERVLFYAALSKEGRAHDLKIHNESIQRQQQSMDTLTQAKPFPEETLVLVHLPWVSKGLNSKLAYRWHGPFKIISVLKDAYMLQDSNQDSETSKLIKVAKGRVRRYHTLQGELETPEGKVRRSDGVQDWVTPGLQPCRAELEPELDVIDDEPVVSVVPKQVTTIMFDLTRPNEVETELQRQCRVINLCAMLVAQYYPAGLKGLKEHELISSASWTGDHGRLAYYIQKHPSVVDELVDSLYSPNIVTIHARKELSLNSDANMEFPRISIPTDVEIEDHYVLLPHLGQLKARNSRSEDPISEDYCVIVYCTAAGDSISRLAKWTGLKCEAFCQAPLHMNGIQHSQDQPVRFRNKSSKLPPNTWIIVDTEQFVSSAHLNGTWHRYNPVTCTWHSRWGQPMGPQAVDTSISQDYYPIEHILAQRPSAPTESDSHLMRYVIRWKGDHAPGDQHDGG